MSKALRILLTNDDSHDSPLFLYTIAALRELGELDIVVPAEEQSWKGKAMTRVGPVYAEHIDLHGTPAFAVTGTPADCVNLAIHNLLEHRPDVVVSGTNIGKNVGVGFIFASGTVGACIEANIAGIPALALSQELTPSHFEQWMTEREFSSATSAWLATHLGEVIPQAFERYCTGGHAVATTWNVNFPAKPAAQMEFVPARIGHTFYDACFVQKGDQYHHNLKSVTVDEDPQTDDCVIRSGHASVTEIDVRQLGQQI